MKQKLIIYWSRRDFRLHDNLALRESLKECNSQKAMFLPVFFVEPYMTQANPKYQFGYPLRYFIAKALPEFCSNFEKFLILNEKPTKFFIEISKDYEVEIFVNEDVYPDFYLQVEKIKKSNININVLNDQLTVDRNTRTGSGSVYGVFTPFKKAVWVNFVNQQVLPKSNPKNANYFEIKNINFKVIENIKFENLISILGENENMTIGNEVLNLKELNLPKRNLENWYFSENEAIQIFKKFVQKNIVEYDDARNMLDQEGTSKMSLALAWGLVSSRMLVDIIKQNFDSDFKNIENKQASLQGANTFISELIWREFYKYLLYHRPELVSKPFQEKYKKIKWISGDESKKRFIAWATGQTGYKIVDSAMMQLAQTGWMHNRTRMIVSSILTKNLGVNWLLGQEYFRAMLIDLDESSNIGGWQWGASVGADPKPIRIFNPYLQAEKFDPNDIYQKKWLSSDYLQNPPNVLIEHSIAREQAIVRYKI